MKKSYVLLGRPVSGAMIEVLHEGEWVVGNFLNEGWAGDDVPKLVRPLGHPIVIGRKTLCRWPSTEPDETE